MRYEEGNGKMVVMTENKELCQSTAGPQVIGRLGLKELLCLTQKKVSDNAVMSQCSGATKMNCSCYVL